MEIVELNQTPIILTDIKIIDFFNEHPTINPNKFVLSHIKFFKSNAKYMQNISGGIAPPSSTQTEIIATPTITTEEEIKINKYILSEITKEYQQFLNTKDFLIGKVKEEFKKTMDQLTDLSFPCLEKCLIDNFSEPKVFEKIKYVNQLKCELCNFYTCNNKRSLSSHQRGCKKYAGSL
jgi:hypothetical protein